MIVFWMHDQYQCCCEKNVQYLNNSYFIYFSKAVMKVLFCFIRGYTKRKYFKWQCFSPNVSCVEQQLHFHFCQKVNSVAKARFWFPILQIEN